MTEKELAAKPKLKEWAAKELLLFFTACPRIVESGIGLEAFVEELNKAAIKLADVSSDIEKAIRNLQQFITACPQIVQSGKSIENFAEELLKAAAKYNLYFEETKT
jgi:type II secretory pathway component PulF